MVLQDREEPNSVDKHLSDVPFEAKFAEEETNATEFSEDSGSDGFVMNSAPLFEVVTSNHRTDLVFKPVVTSVVVLSSHLARGILHSINCGSNGTIFGRKAYWDLVRGIQGQPFTNHNSCSSPRKLCAKGLHPFSL